jgi:Ion channel
MQSISVSFRLKPLVNIIYSSLFFVLCSLRNPLGFGDIHPTSTGARIFTCFFIVGGILNITLAVALMREVLLEAVALGFQARVQAIRTHQHERRIRTRWRTAVKLRLKANNLPMWVADGGGECHERDWQYHHHHHWWRWALQGWNSFKKRFLRKSVDKRCLRRQHLNLRALTEAQMEEAALEAGAPLADLLPPGLHMSLAADDMEGDDDEEEHITDRSEVSFIHSMTIQDEASLKDTIAAQEKIAVVARLTVALLVFIVFWMVHISQSFLSLRHL